jgi:arylsulfatase A-like enzyme/Tfp pilus assembly protein PilF
VPAGLTVAALAIAGALLFWRRPIPYSSGRRRDNVLLITLDTTRADHLGCYGWSRARTPHFDRLAAEGVRFEHAFASAPITLPSHASILTGLYPPAHGVRNNGNFYLAERFQTLATLLHGQGYRTAAFVSSFILDRRYGLARGFDVYDDRIEGAQPGVISLGAERRGDRTSHALSLWLESYAAAPSAPFFAWLHLYDPHEPYRPPPPFRDLFADAPYDGEIAFDDAIVASILDKLGRLGLLDHTLIAVVADHGESLGEHGEETHSMFVYDAAIRVPLLLWRPGTLPGGTVVQDPVRTIDLAPTLLDLVGAPALPRIDGRSLLPLVEGRDKGPTPLVYAETYLPQFYMNWSPLRAVRSDRFKLIEAPRPELYDLAQDPGELHDLHDSRADTARALKSRLDAITGGGAGAMNVAALDREAMEKLAALGYVGAGAEPQPARSGADDPKDMIAIFNRLRRANSAVREGRFADALPILDDVLRRDPRNAFARLVKGSAQMGAGHHDEAIRWFRRYLEIVPSSAYAHLWIAICYARMGDAASAHKEAEATLAIDPRFTDARVLRAGLFAVRGEYESAVGELRTAIATDPNKPVIRVDLAKILSEAGRTAEARSEYEAAVKLQPDFVPALIGLAVLDANAGTLEAAGRGLRRALEINPRADDARFNLASVLERQGRQADAAAEYQRLVEAPGTTPDVGRAARARLDAIEHGIATPHPPLGMATPRP